MSRKHELLNLMNIDTSWIKNIPNSKMSLSNFTSLELEAKNCHACSLSILFSMKLSRDNVYITNTVKCRPPENRNPNSDEINSCSRFLDGQISLISPNIIILLGKVAAERLMNTSEPMSSLRGKVHYYKNTDIPMLVFYHPAYLLRSPSEKSKVWDDILLMKSITYGS